MAQFRLDDNLSERLITAIVNCQRNAENAINEVLWDYGGNAISEAIMPLLPRSGRTWRGKKKAAADAKPFKLKKENLSVIVGTKYDYHYLYFPDDGSTTTNHEGNQAFMLRGAQSQQEDIINRCIQNLIEGFEL